MGGGRDDEKDAATRKRHRLRSNISGLVGYRLRRSGAGGGSGKAAEEVYEETMPTVAGGGAAASTMLHSTFNRYSHERCSL